MRTATLCLLFVVACSAPQRDYDADKIAAVKDLDELMHVQATVADPRFKMAKKLSGKELSGNDFEAFIDMGRRLQLTAKRLPEFSRGEEWNGFAKQLGDQAIEIPVLITGTLQHGNSGKVFTELLIFNDVLAGN